MPTEKPRFTITMDGEIQKAVDDYRVAMGMKSQSQAVVELVQMGLYDYYEKNGKNLKEISIGKRYGKLDVFGKRVIEVVISEEEKRILVQKAQKSPSSTGEDGPWELKMGAAECLATLDQDGREIALSGFRTVASKNQDTQPVEKESCDP